MLTFKDSVSYSKLALLILSALVLTLIITQARLQQAAGESDAVNCVRFLYICRDLGHPSLPTTW